MYMLCGAIGAAGAMFLLGRGLYGTLRKGRRRRAWWKRPVYHVV
jgi:hypothetical protein